MEPTELQKQIVRAVAADARHRRLLSPAEALNALTVGATDEDASTGSLLPQWREPFVDQSLPSLINAQGMGYRRAIKPELLAPGGRVMVQEYLGSAAQALLSIYDGTLPPRADRGRSGKRRWRGQCGLVHPWTSNATALVSRGAALLSGVLDELRRDLGGESNRCRASVGLAEGALGSRRELVLSRFDLNEILRTPENSRRFKEYLTRLLGYGSLDFERVRECTSYRVTAIGGGYLASDESHHHRFPLPPSLSGQRGHRRLTITLAWLTPVNPRHQSWRRADLWFAPPKDALRVDRQQADWQAVQRGTLQHEILEGSKAAVYTDGTKMDIQVSCRSDAGVLKRMSIRACDHAGSG